MKFCFLLADLSLYVCMYLKVQQVAIDCSYRYIYGLTSHQTLAELDNPCSYQLINHH